MAVSSYSDLKALAQEQALDVLGGFHPNADNKTPETCKTLILLGPDPRFWDMMKKSPEMKDGQKDPIDRWSKRVIGEMARTMGGQARFPFGGPPYQPFYSWALETRRIWSSPVKLAVHDKYGLFVSFRGALLLPYLLDLPNPPDQPPCETCDKPCLTACPVDALNGDGYAVETCHDYLNEAEGQECMGQGCAVRRACPVGKSIRDPEQSAYHMSLFHRPEQL